MDFTTFLWTTLGAFLTLATFSFLYKDNPFYKIAEHLVVGVSAGYFAIVLWHNNLVPNLFQRLADGNWYFLWINSSRWEYLIPGILGLLMFTRFKRETAWMSRWPMALYIGIGSGLAIPLELTNRVIRQFEAMMIPINFNNFFGLKYLDPTAGYSQIIAVVGTLCALAYFFFSKPHKGAFGGVAKLGIWILMLGFGSSFGFTVMARISLFVQRIQYIDQDWARHAFDTSNQNYHGGFQAVFWFLILIVIAYIVWEIVKHLKSKGRPTTSDA